MCGGSWCTALIMYSALYYGEKNFFKIRQWLFFEIMVGNNLASKAIEL